MNIEFETTIDIEGFTIHVTIEADGSVHRDNNYGADADGRRGVTRDFVDDVKLKIIDGGGNDLADKLKEKYGVEYRYCESLAEEKLHEAFAEEQLGGW